MKNNEKWLISHNNAKCQEEVYIVSLIDTKGTYTEYPNRWQRGEPWIGKHEIYVWRALSWAV